MKSNRSGPLRRAGFPAAATLALALLLPARPAAADPQQEAAAAAGGGGRLSAGTLETATAAGQTEATGIAHSGRYTLYTGLIGAAFIRPALLSRRGLPLEADPDNDGDGLYDEAELTGSAYGGLSLSDPNAWDTDGDGMSDGSEAAGGYNPLDPGDVLKITAVESRHGTNTVEWIARSGIQTILQGTRPDACTQVVHEADFPGGSPPWYMITNRYSWAAGPATNRFLRVRSSP